jgi:hypothetical protein
MNVKNKTNVAMLCQHKCTQLIKQFKTPISVENQTQEKILHQSKFIECYHYFRIEGEYQNSHVLTQVNQNLM